MKKIYAIFVCLLFLGTMLAASATVVAPKPPDKPGKPGGGGGAGPTGTIFFNMYDDNDDMYIWTIDPDGNGLTKQNLIVDSVQSLSWKTHNEHYWYIGLVVIDGETYHDGQPRQEIYAIRDDNTMGFQMTSDEDMAFPQDQGEQLIWVPGDVYISWVGKVWTDQDDGTYAYDDYGIYRAEVQYDDANGDVSGLGEPDFVYDTGSCYDEDDDVYYPDIYGYDWNLGGDKIAFQRHDGYIYFDSVPTGGSPTQLVKGFQPKLSPDGTKIAFGRYLEILVIDVDGTDETSLVRVKINQGTFKGVIGHEWSLDSKYVVYTKWEVGRATWNWKATMYTIKPDGSGRSSISGLSVDTWKGCRDWR